MRRSRARPWPHEQLVAAAAQQEGLSWLGEGVEVRTQRCRPMVWVCLLGGVGGGQ